MRSQLANLLVIGSLLCAQAIRTEGGGLRFNAQRLGAREHAVLRRTRVLGNAQRPEGDSGGIQKLDFTSREGLGENLPVRTVDYLGAGYDIIKGNPDGDPQTQVDPGYREPVVQLTWSQEDQHVSRDMQFLHPKGGYSMPEYSCHQTTHMTQVSSEQQYSAQLQAEASVGIEGSAGPLANVAFTASAAYDSFVESVAQSDAERFEMRSYCLYHKVGFYLDAEGEGLSLVPRFESRAKQVVAADNEKTWISFFNEFGTHLIREVHLGGKYIHRTEMDSLQVQRIENSGRSLELMLEAESVSGTGGHLGGKLAAETTSDQQAASTNMNSATLVLGGMPPASDGKDTDAFGTWAQTVPEYPMPVKIKLEEFYHVKGQDGNPIMTQAQYEKGVGLYAALLKRRREEAAKGKPRTQLRVREALSSDAARVQDRTIESQDGGAQMVLNEDGTLEILSGGVQLWSVSPPDGAKKPFSLEWNDHMSLVLVDGSKGTPYWLADVSPNWCGGAVPSGLTLHKHGEAVIRTSMGVVLWSSDSKVGSKATSSSGVLGDPCKQGSNDGTLSRGQHIAGRYVHSAQAFEYELTANCDFIIRQRNGVSPSGTLVGQKPVEVFHQAATHDRGQGCKLSFGIDGELMTTDSAGDHWTAGVSDKKCTKKRATRVVFESGRVVVKDKDGAVILRSEKGDPSKKGSMGQWKKNDC